MSTTHTGLQSGLLCPREKQEDLITYKTILMTMKQYKLYHYKQITYTCNNNNAYSRE